MSTPLPHRLGRMGHHGLRCPGLFVVLGSTRRHRLSSLRYTSRTGATAMSDEAPRTPDGNRASVRPSTHPHPDGPTCVDDDGTETVYGRTRTVSRQ